MRYRLSVTLPLLLMAACSGQNPQSPDVVADVDAEGDVKAPSTAQATAILQAVLDKERQCTTFYPMPRDVPTGAEYSYARQQMQVFVDAGVVRREGEVTKPRDSDPSVQDKYDRYVATPEGAKSIRTSPGGGTLICYGRRAIQSVEVLAADPMTREVDVRYRFQLADVPGWARSPAVQAAFPAFKDWLDKPDDSRETLRVVDGRWTLAAITDGKMFDFGTQGR